MKFPPQEILTAIEAADSFLVASHYNPDGDAIGSMAAMGFLLQALGKSYDLYNYSGLPERYSWLELPKSISTHIPDHNYEWVFLLDCGDLDRSGDNFMSSIARDKLINIDHHMGNPEFGGYNWVDPSCSAVGEMISLFARHFEVPLSKGLGQAIYLALITDTGSFSYSNTKPETLELAAEIIRNGLDPGEFTSKLQNQWTLNKAHLVGKALQGIELFHEDKIGVISATQKLMQETQTSQEDCEGLINLVRQIKGVQIAVSLRENGENTTKFSLRSWGDTNVRDVAVFFGGGGHLNASGGLIKAPLPEAKQVLVNTIAEVLSF
jgi:phosphoesterase RecJ-like protein